MPTRWWCLALLLLLIGFTVPAKPDTSTQPGSSAKDCRRHIEKALEQYWDEDGVPQHDATPNADEHEHDDDADDDELQERVKRSSDQDQDEDDDDGTDSNQDDDDDETDSNQDDENDDDDSEIDGTSELGNEHDDGSDDDGDSDNSDEHESKHLNDNTDEDNDGNDDGDEDDDDDDSEEVDRKRADGIPLGRDVLKNYNINHPEENEEVNNDDDDDDDDDEDDDDDDENEENVESSAKPSTHLVSDKDTRDGDDDDNENKRTDGKESTAQEAIVPEKLNQQEKTTEASTDKTITESKKDEKPAETVQVKPAEIVQVKPSETVQVKPALAPVLPAVEIPKVHAKEEEPQTDDDDDDDDDDNIENIYDDDDDEDDEDSEEVGQARRRDHVDAILGLDEVGSEYEREAEKAAQATLREIKRIQAAFIKPVEALYKYGDATTRMLTDAEIFSKPSLLFLGPWSAGKTSLINYLLGIERTPSALKTGTGVTDVDFTLLTYGETRRVTQGTELAVDWRYAGLQKFGQGFLDRFRGISLPCTLLKKVTLVDSPGILESAKNSDRGFDLRAAFRWFADRADAVYVVLDPTKVDIGAEMGAVIDLLAPGREVRFILNKADTVRRSDLLRVVGQLFWNLSPLVSGAEAPRIHAVSMATRPFRPHAPARFLLDQERNLLTDMRSVLDSRVENRVLYARRHAVRVRNHAKMVDCYLNTYYHHKSIFSSKRNVAKQITENPKDYRIFDGVSSMANVSRSDIPDPGGYRDFFHLHPLYEFKLLASTCSYFRGCPMDKLDQAITKEIPELFAKYKKTEESRP